jgi:Glycine-rich domain-containing protein-like
LVAAALRQREFSKKITGTSCRALDSPQALFKATTRYHKFLLLIKRRANGKGGKNGLVPTLDIDLCWHTHQLAAHSYREWCIEHLGLVINHDDSIGEKSLNSGLRETSLAWYDAYRQSYAREDLSEAYASKGRTVAGVLIPPYGLFVRNKGKKLKQAQMGSAPPNSFVDVIERGEEEYMSMYPYWLALPEGWDYPASCATDSNTGGWAASVDLQRGKYFAR